MSKRKVYLIGVFSVFAFLTWFYLQSIKSDGTFSEKVKISLREVGHQLLLSNQDSTSVILPVIEQSPLKYTLSFENPFSFEPGNLVSSIADSFKKADLPEQYLVETIQCTTEQVAYSYQMSPATEETIVPCFGRILPKECYTIEVRFTDVSAPFFGKKTALYLLFFAISIFILIEFFNYRRKQSIKLKQRNAPFASLGSFQFYPEQNKLIKEAVEINLSKKECELLAIFVAHPNQIIKRDELTKKVWEDNGVIVGRSLDTYISKLRKKLQDDDTIKLTNVHGVGYKLEVR